MCLNLIENKANAKIADKDIICYKVLKVKDDSLFSPFMEHKYELGATVTAKEYDRHFGYCARVIAITKDNKRFRVRSCVRMGVLHTFKNLENAREFMTTNDDYVIVKCTIPKGDKYYEGLFQQGHYNSVESYASKTLVVSHEILESTFRWRKLIFGNYDTRR